MAMMMLSFECKIVNGHMVRADRLTPSHPVILNGVVGELLEAEFVNDPNARGQQVRVKFLFHNPEGHYTQEHTVDREFTFQTLQIFPIKENILVEEPAVDEPAQG
jgi:hypothetical protein